MIDMTLEEDLPEEFRGGTLRLNSEHKGIEPPKSPNPASGERDSELHGQNNCHWRKAFISPLSSIPKQISESIWSSKGSKDVPPTPNEDAEKSLQPSFVIKENPNNFFTFRDGVVDRAVRESVTQFLDLETEGPILAAFLLTQINHWDTDKERLALLTAKNLLVIKYDFIALKRMGCRKIPLAEIDGVVVGNLVYPSGSLIPDRNMKGVRLLLRQDKPETLASKWNPFNDDVPYLTFTFHPLYFHKDCTDEKLRSLYNLDLFVDHICAAVTKSKENSVILQHNILLENYVGLGSIIHNRHSLGFFKVRGKFSF
ncbi:unnamed protein product [Callosobruchus maculatus]|uniref:HSac2 domain-containing protein n=1 Tax=Callosobruchus maculatus TaxID=64391 RepID=A0A653CXW1_CALMS|nr:unnamed protein product [Callosobruchus maculatus]